MRCAREGGKELGKIAGVVWMRRAKDSVSTIVQDNNVKFFSCHDVALPSRYRVPGVGTAAGRRIGQENEAACDQCRRSFDQKEPVR